MIWSDEGKVHSALEQVGLPHNILWELFEYAGCANGFEENIGRELVLILVIAKVNVL